MTVKKRLFVISDIHIDYSENLEVLLALSDSAYRSDSLIIAGDASDDLSRLDSFFGAMSGKFENVLFVPGNHELWLKRSPQENSIAKFEAIVDLCKRAGIHTDSIIIGEQQKIAVVPLLSWYHTAEHPLDTLYLEKPNVEDKTADMWSDFFLTQWPETVTANVCDYFLALNNPALQQHFDIPVVSFSHFLPRQELMLSTKAERNSSQLTFKDLHPEFNFSHVAGSKALDRQIRQLGSRVHIYGHQHRNRVRTIDGVTYVSHCMGYPKERRLGVVADACVHPLEIWNDQQGFLV
ncbi:MAG: metallophosphatase family protein [Pseudomonadales bacterium]|nr:metallophosphatase family protein [Pseudomonadales bacterium]